MFPILNPHPRRSAASRLRLPFTTKASFDVTDTMAGQFCLPYMASSSRFQVVDVVKDNSSS